MEIVKVRISGEGYLANDSNWYPSTKMPKELIEWLESSTPEPQYTPDEIYEQILARGERIVEEHIQEPIDTYNLTHGLKFKDAHACSNYKENIHYPHHVFCGDIWMFNVGVWMIARNIQSDVSNGTIAQPTDEEFKAMLPIYNGTV